MQKNWPVIAAQVDELLDMTGPTERQSEILAILREHEQAGLSCPSQQEIAECLGIAQQTVAFHLRALERKGLIERPPASHRAIRASAP